MPGTLVPNQMYDHELNVLKGWFAGMHFLDHSGPIADGETILAGSVVYKDGAGEFRSGNPDNTLAMFAWPNSADFDVSADVGNIQSFNLTALPVTGAYEVQTTEFETALTYNVNDYLGAHFPGKPNYSASELGKIYVGVPYVDTIVGIVSKGATENDFKKEVVSLWTYHLPIAVP